MRRELLVISYLNLRGQTGFTVEKQLQVEEFLKFSKSDILHLQESQIETDTFTGCHFIEANFSVITNNAENNYGTASLIKNDLKIDNVIRDTKGRILVFEIAGTTFGNVYLPLGTDASNRSDREKYCGETIPNMLTNCKPAGCIGGDFNCIINKSDATNFPDSKMSPCLARLARAFGRSDSFRVLHPNSTVFSRYYEARGSTGATRIDRQYQWGEIRTVKAEYIPVALSDHLAHTVHIQIPEPMIRMCSPSTRPMFKVREEVVQDKLFQDRLHLAMYEWEQVRKEGLAVLPWWEMIVKPGIRKLAMERSKEINQERRSLLNLLLLRQSYLIRKIQKSKPGEWDIWRRDLIIIQARIQQWYKEIAEKIKHQSRVDEFQESEKTRIYHHEIHRKHIRKSSILKLETDTELLEGHDQCAEYLEGLVSELLLKPADLDQAAQQVLLGELDQIVTEPENDMLGAVPTKQEVHEALKAANAKGAPGTDGIPSLLYKVCWDFLGDSLTDVTIAKFQGEKLPASMRTSMMVFGPKPKKLNSIKPKDKRRISLLNCDFKLIEGVEARRIRKIGSRVLSPCQYVAGKDRNIHHGIAKARDAIQSVTKTRLGCGIADMDFMAAFDWLVLSWVWKVLLKIGVKSSTVRRLQDLYRDCVTIVVVNNKLGRVMLDRRGSLRQGGCASMEWFCFGIDPLLRYLERRLQGIPIYSLPVMGPVLHGESMPLPPLEERYKLIAYCDDVKPSVTTMSEFITVDRACSIFEKSSGCKLHRDPRSGKCKFLPLGRWRGVLDQEDIPLNYMEISESLEIVGVELKALWSQSRKTNGDSIQSRVSNRINSWKSGKFMDLSCRPWSLNSYALSRVWFKCHTVDLRIADISGITSKIKSWLFQDLLEKPQEFVLYRPINMGGLGLQQVKYKALATLIKSFMETAANPAYRQNLLHSALYRYYVLKDDSIDKVPPLPPYYSLNFFETIRQIKETTPLKVETMSTAQWYRVLVEVNTTMVAVGDNKREYIKSRAELASPDTDWEASWSRARLRGIGSEASSFLWQTLHNLLPTEERLSRFLPNTSEQCKLCQPHVMADQVHCFFFCISTKEVGNWILSIIKSRDPTITPSKLLKLQFQCEDSEEMPLVWLTAQTLNYIWRIRASGKTVDLTLTRAVLESKISLLRETRYQNEKILLSEYINL